MAAQPSSFVLECESIGQIEFNQNQEEPENGCPCYEGTIGNTAYVMYFGDVSSLDGLAWMLVAGVCGNHGEFGEELLGNVIFDCFIQRATPLGSCQITPVDPPDPIPTLSQWGMVFLVLFLAIFGLVFLKQRSVNLG